MSKIVTAHSACISEFSELLGLNDRKVCEISFTVGGDEPMYLITKEYVSEDDFSKVINILRKYGVTEIPKEETK